MRAVVASVVEDSIAQELGIQSGDIVLKISGVVLSDYIEYKYLTASEDLELEIQKADGSIEVIEIEKDFDEDLGLVFESAIFDKIKPCTNNCIFCFVDQQPEGLRDSLYVKDDDYRLSYLQGTYITLTNLSEKDKKRIEEMHLGPLYISVHTTNPELRVKMLRNPKALDILEHLKWLKKSDIPIHTQIVLCPGYNDKEELDRTFNDLYRFKSIVESIAIVPVGVTKYREDSLKMVDKELALDTIKRIKDFNSRIGSNLASASDEFFLLAESSLPETKYYNEFVQLEDGVGTLRLIKDDFDSRKHSLPLKIEQKKEYTLATSFAAFDVFQEISLELNKIKNLSIEVIAIKSNFWGEHINVAGLITGNDLIEQLKSKNIKNLIISSVMLRSYSEEFLDGLTISDIEKNLNCEITVIKDTYSTQELINIITK